MRALWRKVEKVENILFLCYPQDRKQVYSTRSLDPPFPTYTHLKSKTNEDEILPGTSTADDSNYNINGCFCRADDLIIWLENM